LPAAGQDQITEGGEPATGGIGEKPNIPRKGQGLKQVTSQFETPADYPNQVFGMVEGA